MSSLQLPLQLDEYLQLMNFGRYVDLRACITRIPDKSYGANVSTWPERLHHPPDRLQTIEMDAYASRKEILKAESKYWKEIIQSYISAFRWRDLKIRNVMDMRAGFGGYIFSSPNFFTSCSFHLS